MKKILAAVITVAMMICCVVPSFAEVWQGTDEIVPELIKVPKVTTPLVLDGVIEDAWGENAVHVIGSSRAEDPQLVHPTDGTFLDEASAMNATVDYWFKWDEEYLYVAIKAAKVYSSEVDGSALWSAGTDCFQFYIGLDDGDGDMYNDPHLGFGINGNQDATELFFNTFEQSMPDAADSATVTDGMKGKCAVDGLYQTYEIAIPLADGLGSAGAIDDEYLISVAFISDGSFYAEMGQGVLWSGKTPTNSPMLVFAEAPAEEAPAEEPAAEEPAAEEPAAEEPAAEEPAAEEPAAEEPAATETVTPAPTTTTNNNPKTADVSVLFYALAAVSAIGGISVFKRK